MKTTFTRMAISAMAIMSTVTFTSCGFKASQPVAQETVSIEPTDPELWAAMNKKLELKEDRGVMETSTQVAAGQSSTQSSLWASI